MSGLNKILSTLPPSGMIVDKASSVNNGVAGPQQGQSAPSTSPAGDIFEKGQWWKNRSRASAAEDSSGDWREKTARRAYGAQSAMGVENRNGAAAAEESKGLAGEKPSAEQDGAAAQQSKENAPSGEGLTREEQQAVSKLRMRDAEVRSHEQAHLAAAGGYARGGASFQFERGPDGKKYAVGGEVPIDVAPESEPDQTIRKMNIVRAAALAPANPSPQDRRIASSAAFSIGVAQRDLAEIRQEEAEAKREEMAQRSESAADERAGSSDSSAVGGVQPGKEGGSQALRRYGEPSIANGGVQRQSISHTV